jgi:hypothetical protein
MIQPTNVQELKANIVDPNTLQRIRIDRQEFWADSVATFKDPQFNLKASPRVVFLGEAGIDAGGLRREYATLLCREIFSANASLFEGTDKNKLPIFSIQAIQSRLLFLAGKMIAYNIVHQDIGVPCLSPAFYAYMVSANIEESSPFCSLNDIADYNVKQWIQQVGNN